MKVSNRHKRPRSANTNFRDNRIWKLDHFQTARIVFFSFELKSNIVLHDRRTPVLSCHVCIISYWWGKFKIQCKTFGHALYVNNFSVQERLTRESIYLYDGSKRCFPNARNVNPPQMLDLLWFMTIRHAFTVLLLYARLWEHLADTTSAHARGAWFRTLRCVSKGDRTVRTKFESAFIKKLSEITAWNFDSW